MNPVPVQWITREMAVRLGGPVSLLRGALHEAEWERAAAPPLKPHRRMWRLGDWPSGMIG